MQYSISCCFYMSYAEYDAHSCNSFYWIYVLGKYYIILKTATPLQILVPYLIIVPWKGNKYSKYSVSTEVLKISHLHTVSNLWSIWMCVCLCVCVFHMFTETVAMDKVQISGLEIQIICHLWEFSQLFWLGFQIAIFGR
jgi:hypothetical protein